MNRVAAVTPAPRHPPRVIDRRERERFPHAAVTGDTCRQPARPGAYGVDAALVRLLSSERPGGWRIRPAGPARHLGRAGTARCTSARADAGAGAGPVVAAAGAGVL